MTREKFIRLFNKGGFPSNMLIDYDDFYSENEILRFTDSEIRSFIMERNVRVVFRIMVSAHIHILDYFERAKAANRAIREMFPNYQKLSDLTERMNNYMK